jgi:pro-apoptotic serine protease NMA111
LSLTNDQLDFRLKAVTFDNVNWVVTMKKNDHYFPTTEWIKDPTESCGWRRLTYEDGKPIKGEGHDGINNVVGDSFEMDEGGGMVS